MGSLDDLPRDNPQDRIDLAATEAFEAEIARVAVFRVQQKDRRDYGSDYQLEVVRDGARTNVRVHVQLKGTTTDPNLDGSVSIRVARRNLNYLLSPADSIYVCHHVPTGRTLVRGADDVCADYERRFGQLWKDQETIAVRFSEAFDETFQRQWQRLALARSRDAARGRLAWAGSPPDRMTEVLISFVPAISVPASVTEATALLQGLYARGADDIISRASDQFRALLDTDVSSLDYLHMAEINIGLNSKEFNFERIRTAIEYFKERGQRRPCISSASISYSLGNAYLALREYEAAVPHFEKALASLLPREQRNVGSMCWKNLGSALEGLGRWEDARSAFEKALELDPNLDEAHFALGLWFNRETTDLVRALDHLDRVSGSHGNAVPPRPALAWKASVLFRLDRFDEAFATIDAVLADKTGSWEWPWCARLVREHGKRTTAAAAKALKFWRRFLRIHPNDRWALSEEFTCAWALHQEGEPCGLDLRSFIEKGQALLNLSDVDTAIIWDRIGHWAHTDRDWTVAEDAYRKAHEKSSTRYAYCLGTALNHLGRWKDALDVLLPAVEADPFDALSWFQISVARDKLGDAAGAVEGYARTLNLDSSYAKAHFNLGGVLWNAGARKEAIVAWKEALRRFPTDPLSEKLLGDLPFLAEG